MFRGKLISLLAVHVDQPLNLAFEVVFTLGGVQHEEDHLDFLALLQLLEYIVEVNALGQAVAFSDPENGPFESDLFICVDNARPECDLSRRFHEDGPKLIHTGLGTGKKSSSKLLLTCSDDC